MKVFDIIREAAPPPGPTPPGMTWNGTMYVPAGTPPTAPAPTPPVDTKPSKKVGPLGPREVKPGDGKSAIKDIRKYIKDKQAEWRKDKLRADRIEKVWMGRYGFWMIKLFQVLGLVLPITYLYMDLEAWEQEYADAKGEISQTQYEQGREFLFGDFEISAVVPMVTRSLTRITEVVLIARIIKNIAGVASAGVTMGVSVGAIIATEVFFIWLQNWLQTGSGKDFLVWLVGTWLIRMGGKPLDLVVSKLTDAYEKAEKHKQDKIDPAGAPERDRKTQQDKTDLEKSKDLRKELGV